MVRAHVTALGGNAMVSFYMSELTLVDNPHKNQVGFTLFSKRLLNETNRTSITNVYLQFTGSNVDKCGW